MVNQTDTLDQTFSALGNGLRRQMLAEMAEGWVNAGELADRYQVSAPAISRHLRILESADLIERRKHSREVYCRLRPEPVRQAVEWLGFYRDYWDAQFMSLAEFLDEGDQHG
jgi:DNA-binding transcriptional ArsR family regulator